MTKTTTKAKATIKESAPLIVLSYDENHKPRAARFPAKDAELVAKAARSWTSKSMKRPPKTWPLLPKSCRRAGSTAQRPRVRA